MKRVCNCRNPPICSIHMSPLKIVSETQTIHKNNSESYSVSFLKIIINQYKINFLTIQIYSKNSKIQHKNLPKPLKNKHYSELTLKLHSRKEIIYKITLKIIHQNLKISCKINTFTFYCSIKTTLPPNS